MITKVSDYMQKNHMTDPGDVIIVGVSGGADSLCLLLVLQELTEKFSLHLEVVHVNHGIRADAAFDEAFVETFCKQKKIPFHAVHADVERLAGEHHVSTEEMGRTVRYEAFEKALGERRGKIAVAHNANDRAETMLFHLFRGTGLRGACGIRPVQGKVIRPLLSIQRKEIEGWLQEQEVSFCIDETNLGDQYTRNRIRHHILAYAEEEIADGAIANMNRAAAQFQEADEYLEQLTQKAFSKYCRMEEEGSRIVFDLEQLYQEDEYLRKRIIFQGICTVAGQRKDLTQEHVLLVDRLFRVSGNRELHLPYDLYVYKQYEKGMIQKGNPYRQELLKNLPEYAITVPGKYAIPSLGCVEFQIFPYVKSKCIPQKTYTKWFDYDKITKSLFLRTRQTGDYLTINDQMGKKSLKSYLIDCKFPKEKRNSLYVLAMEHHIVWIPGFRMSEYYKVEEQTRTILQVKIITQGNEE